MREHALRIGHLALLALLLLAALKVGFDMLRMLSWEIPGPMHGDAGTYTYTARAMLNGLTPYVDIFSARPHGIHILFAASLLLTGGNALSSFVQIATFVLTPLLCVLFALKQPQAKPKTLTTWIIALTVFIASALLILYTEERSGGLQPEGIGYFFSIIYALLLLKTELKSKWSIALGSLMLLSSIGMKEPFLLTNLAIALLLSKSWKDLPRTFLLPLAIAGVLGVLGMLMLGTLKPYFTMHIANMIENRVAQTDEWNPMWARGLNTGRIYANIVSYYTTGKFTGWLIIALFSAAPLLFTRLTPERNWRSGTRDWAVLACATIATFTAFQAANLLYLYLYVSRNNPGMRVAFDPSTYPWMIACAISFLGLLLLRRKLLLSVLFTLLIAYITVFTIGAGAAYQPNFYVFAVPVYIALLLLWTRKVVAGEITIPVAAIAIVLTIIASFHYRPDPKHVSNMRGLLIDQNYSSNKEDAAHLDALLDACGFDRYVSAVGNPAFAHAKHSPWGPLPGLIEPRYMPPDNEYTRKTEENILERTQIILHDEEEWDRPIINANLAVIEERFTEEPPDCAQPYLPFHDYTILFRK